MKTLFTILFLSASTCVFAQPGVNSVLNSSGNSGTVGTEVFEWSIGEMTLVHTKTAQRHTLTNGFLQPFIVIPKNPGNDVTASQPKFEVAEFSARELGVYPNPAISYTDVSINAKSKGRIVITVLNSEGKAVIMEEFAYAGTGSVKRIQVGNLKQGTYLIDVDLVADDPSQSRQSSYKIIKVQ